MSNTIRSESFYLLRIASTTPNHPQWLFTDNETSAVRHPDLPCESRYFKDAFNQRIVEGDTTAVNPDQIGTKCAALPTDDHSRG